MDRMKWTDYVCLLMEAGNQETEICDLITRLRRKGDLDGAFGFQIPVLKGKNFHLNTMENDFFVSASPASDNKLLHAATAASMHRATFMLLGYGLDPNRPDHLGRTPLQLAKTPAMRALLISAGARSAEAEIERIERDLDQAAATPLPEDGDLLQGSTRKPKTVSHVAGVKSNAGDDDAAPDAEKRRVAKSWKAELIGLSQIGFIDFARNVALLQKHAGAGGIAAVLDELLSG